MREMNEIIVSIFSIKNVSTIQIKHHGDYVVVNYLWERECCKFPFIGLLKGVCKLLKLKLKRKVSGQQTADLKTKHKEVKQ